MTVVANLPRVYKRFSNFSSLNNATLSKMLHISRQMNTNFENLVDLVKNGIVKVDDSLPVPGSPFIAPSYMDAELQSSEIMDILFEMLNEYFNVASNVAPIYKIDGPVGGCIGSEQRISGDTDAHCSDDDYKEYQLEGACLNSESPGAGLANRGMTRIGTPICTQNGQSSLGDLPNPRHISLAIDGLLREMPFKQEGLTPNLIALTMGQFVTHDTMQHILKGNVNGEGTPPSCSANNRKMAKIFETHTNEAVEVDADDPFYKKFNVRCLQFENNRVINENCEIQKASIVSFLSLPFKNHISDRKHFLPLSIGSKLALYHLAIMSVCHVVPGFS